MLKMAVHRRLGVAGFFIVFCLQIIQGKKVNMLDRCRDDDAIVLSGSEVMYVSIDGSNWWNGRTCVLTFKAEDTYDDLKLKFTKYKVHDCDVKFKVYTSLSSAFLGSVDSSYSCHNTPLLNWKSTKNRYVKLKVTRDHQSITDFSIDLQLSVEDYNPSSDDYVGVGFPSIIGIVVTLIVSVIVIALVIWCCCKRSGRSSGTVFRQNYQAAPVVTSSNTQGNPAQNWGPPPPQQGVQPSAPYPTLPGGQAPPGSYPYGYGYPQSGTVPPAYPPPPAPGYPAQPPAYPAAPPPSIEPSAPPAMMEPPPPYPGQESTPLKGY